MAVVADVVNEEEDVFWTSAAVQKGTVLAHRERPLGAAEITGSRMRPEEAVSDHDLGALPRGLPATEWPPV